MFTTTDINGRILEVAEMRVLVPPIWLGRKLSVLGKKLSSDCRSCPLLEFEFTCIGFRKTFQDAYGVVVPKPCLLTPIGKVAMFLFRRLKLFKGLDDCRTCELRDFCLSSCEAFRTMYLKAYKSSHYQN